MKGTAFALAIFALVLAQGAVAHAHDTPFNLNTSGCDSPARWAPRHDSRDARFAITTENGDATLLLTDRVVAVQLSDRALHKVDRKLKAEQKEGEDNILARTIKTAVLSSVRAVLDHSAECSIRDLRDVEYRRDRLIFTTNEGEHVFEDLDVCDQDVMRSFSESDARAFVREFRRTKDRAR